MPKEVEHWSLTKLREKLVEIRARVVAHGRYVTFQTTEAKCFRIGRQWPKLSGKPNSATLGGYKSAFKRKCDSRFHMEPVGVPSGPNQVAIWGISGLYSTNLPVGDT